MNHRFTLPTLLALGAWAITPIARADVAPDDSGVVDEDAGDAATDTDAGDPVPIDSVHSSSGTCSATSGNLAEGGSIAGALIVAAAFVLSRRKNARS